ncbi:MAG: permease [Epsilonproteobacteria bacterium]|nr:MAG: permease [Campylobacterota bacterium]
MVLSMEFFTSFWSYLVISSPFLLLGIVVAGLLHSFVKISLIKKLMGGKKVSSIFTASLLGIPLPLCSCSVIPTAVTLKKSGASNGATSAFLISTPETGIDSLALTYGLIDLPMTIIRPLAAFLTATVAGILQFIFNEEPEEKIEYLKEKKIHEEGFKARLKSGISYAFNDLMEDMALWLAIGLLVGALINYFIPAEYFSILSGWQGKLLILLVGIPTYICASATTPIAASMIIKGMSPGSALLLLLVGPATNISNILVLQKFIGKKGILINVFSIAIISLLLSFLVDFMYEYFAWPLDFKMTEGHGHEAFSPWEHLSAIFMSLLIIRGIYKEEILKRLKPKKNCCS